MAIVKTIAATRDSRLDAKFSSTSRDSTSSDGDEEARTERSSSDSDGSNVSEVDSGIESDDYDYSEPREAGSEFCKVSTQSCLVPYELYDLQDLTLVLSVDAWNNCLTEEERFALAEYLPDMDQEMFLQTLKELFAGDNLHFGSPMVQFFNQLKGGLCEPRAMLYRRGLNYLQKREHYHRLCNYQNSMVGGLVWIRDAWENYTGYGIEDRLEVLNMLRNQSPLKFDVHRGVGSETNSEDEEVDWKRRPKTGRQLLYPPKPSLNVLSRRSAFPVESAKYGKENPEGTLKATGSKAPLKKGYIGPTGKVHASSGQTQGTTGRGTDPMIFPPHIDRGAEIDYRTNVRIQNGMEDYNDGDFDDDMADQDYEIDGCREIKNKPGKKQKISKRHGRYSPLESHEEENSGCNRWSLSGGKRDADQVVAVASYGPRSLKKPRLLERDRGHPVEGNTQDFALKRAWIDSSAGSQHTRNGRPTGYSDKNSKNKKPEIADMKVNHQKSVHGQAGNGHFYSEQISKSPLRNMRKKASQNGLGDMGYGRGRSPYIQSEDTESDSSEQEDEEENITEYSRRMGHPVVDAEKHPNAIIRSSHGSKKAKKPMKKNKKDTSQAYDRGAQTQMPGVGMYLQKIKKSEANTNYPHGYAAETRTPSGKFADEQRHAYKMMNKGELDGNLSRGTFVKNQATERKRKGHDPEYLLPQSNYVHDYASAASEEDADEFPDAIDGETRVNTPGNRDQVADAHTVDSDSNEPVHMPLVGCKSVTRKKKGKKDNKHLDGTGEPEDRHDSPGKLTDCISSLKRKGKRITEAGTGPLAAMIRESPISPEKEMVAEMETKPARKPFTLITPTVHTGFSFSIVHLLSAVRMAMVTTDVEDTTEVGNSTRDENGDANTSEKQKHMPSLAVQEIVNRVRSNPGDPFILETQEPLQDLVRGVLKIFSSKTAPLGAKGWKALVVYEKSTKSWSWVGPVSPSTADPVEEETSAEAWDIPNKMLVKLVDAFANWLKSGQDTLRQIGSLPPPPSIILPDLDEKERFRDLRAQKSLITISPSSDEVRVYFRKEELLRYQVPDRAFSYTAADGKKSIVAPLRRGGGKPTSKARDHFMLKPDRPPHVTILCLVRDAAARLPGSIGTRADVCTLIRDSQYIVEDVSDGQVNQVVSGALDRLHYERDPCVQYDSERKLWVYLHRDRDEEDFEDDGTSSTKKWKKPRKDTTENPDGGLVADADYQGDGDQAACGTSGYDIDADCNAEPSSRSVREKPEVSNDLRPKTENIDLLDDSVQGRAHKGRPVHWGFLV